jgi:hypothetical protein
MIMECSAVINRLNSHSPYYEYYSTTLQIIFILKRSSYGWITYIVARDAGD